MVEKRTFVEQTALRRRPPELQIMLVASPRNQLYLDSKRSPVSGDLLLSLAALSILARSPFSVIFSWSPLGPRAANCR